MRLIECYIEGFGRLKDYKYEFTDGLNVFNENNGFGKTTLTVFIKAMLYGLEDTKKTKLEENDRKHYIPWQGGRFGGRLIFESERGKFRVERSFGAKASDDEFRLYDCNTGKSSEAYGEGLGEELFGIDADGFERTVFLSERRLSVKNDNKSISAKLSDLVGADADVGVLDDALKLLEEKRKYYYKKGGSGRIGDIKTLITENDLQIGAVLRLKDGYSEKEKRLVALKEELCLLEKKKATVAEGHARKAYREQYEEMKAAMQERQRTIEAIKSDFSGKLPTKEELLEAERCHSEAQRISQSLRKLPLAPSPEKIKAIDGYIDTLTGKQSKGDVNKTFHFWFIGAAAAVAIGVLLGAFVAQILYTVSALALPCLIFALLNMRAVKTATEEASSLEPAMLFVEESIGYKPERDRLLARLIELKSKEEASIRLFEEAKRENERACGELKELQRKYTDFLERFSTAESTTLDLIKGKLLEYEMLERELKEREGQIKDFGERYEIRDLGGKNSDTDRSLEDLDEDCRRIRSEITLLDRECREEAEEIATLDELEGKRGELEEALREAEEYHSTIMLTKKHLGDAKDRLTARYLGRTRAAFNEYIKAIGNECGDDFVMDTSFGIKRSEGASSMPTEAYSLGTRDLYSLAARLALVDALYENELPFIILDDPFVHLDDEKTEAALKLLRQISEKKQIIYLTCSASRSLP